MTDDDREKWEHVKADHHAGVPLTEIIARHGIKPVDFFRRAHAEDWLRKPASDGAQTSSASGVPETTDQETAPVTPIVETSAAAADVSLAWDDAGYAYRIGLPIADIIGLTRLDPSKLLERVMRENWRPDLGLMLVERYGPGEPVDELVKKVDALFQGDGPLVTSVHRCGECGEVVKRPVYCGNTCRLRSRPLRRNEKGAAAQLVVVLVARSCSDFSGLPCPVCL